MNRFGIGFCPVGTSANSPPIYRWVRNHNRLKSRRDGRMLRTSGSEFLMNKARQASCQDTGIFIISQAIKNTDTLTTSVRPYGT